MPGVRLPQHIPGSQHTGKRLEGTSVAYWMTLVTIDVPLCGTAVAIRGFKQYNVLWWLWYRLPILLRMFLSSGLDDQALAN